jgi:small nuclear ribonucleoprotein (snRNP)-like protein
MSKATTGKNKPPSQTIGSLLVYMEGIELIVELKTGRRIRGILSSADEYMNLTLDHTATEEEKKEQRKKEDYSSSTGTGENLLIMSSSSMMSIRGSNIRYIHFPDNADLTGLVRAGVDREQTAANKYKRGKRK